MGVINNVLMCKWDKTLSLALFFVRNSQVNKYVFDYTNMFAPYTVFIRFMGVFSTKGTFGCEDALKTLCTHSLLLKIISFLSFH